MKDIPRKPVFNDRGGGHKPKGPRYETGMCGRNWQPKARFLNSGHPHYQGDTRRGEQRKGQAKAVIQKRNRRRLVTSVTAMSPCVS
jgi:hypothetical protein